MRRHAAAAPVARRENLAHPRRLALAGTDGHQHTGDVAHHVVQKGIGPDIQHDEATMLEHAQVMQGLDRRLGLALHGTERSEVMGTDQRHGRLAHARHVQRAVIPGNFLGQMGRTHRIVVDHIAIAPRHSGEARVEMRRHRLRPGHADVARQIGVGPHEPGLERTLDGGIEMHHLAAGMHGRVGAPGTDQRHRLGRHLGQGLFQRRLDRGHPRLLTLPAAIARALVFHAEGDPGNASGSHFGCRWYCVI
ncbi:hypothetical protein D3C78_1170900 [compost metagenome]